MILRRGLFVSLLLTLLLVIAGCDSCDGPAPSAATSTPADGSTLPHREPPIPGVDATTILTAARAAVPGATEQTFRYGPITSRAYTESKIGFPDPVTGDIFRNSPFVSVAWEDDGTVFFVGCSDLIDAAASSPVMAICSDLPVTGVPPGALDATWQSMLADTWDRTQPFEQLRLVSSRYEAERPTPGPAIDLLISGKPQDGAGATSTSDL